MKRTLAALFVGGAFVAAVELLGHHGVGTPIPFWVLAPGILAGAFAPDSGFNPEGDTHPWGGLSTFIVFAVNVGIYGGLVYVLLKLFGWPHRAQK
jgi:hypothetical protein